MNNLDGVFWMDSIDLLQNFKYFYTCRVLTEREGWFSSERNGKLVKSRNMKDLPQFKLKMTKPGHAFIQIRQLGDIASTYKGPNQFAFICSDENGQKMMKINRRKIVHKSKMSDALVMGDEIFFGEEHSYPHTFTLTVANGARDPICTEEFNFRLTAYTKQEGFELGDF